MFAAATRQLPAADGTINGLDHPDMCRELLPDDSKVYFTHGDLTLRNIMVSGPPGLCRVTAIIDWEQAGWYPEYWEFCKMHFGVAGDHEWDIYDWPSKVLEPDEDAYWAFSTYYQWRTGGT
jgi:aminoglycoside phosphotransferase (APT) family kinase protein